jgi:hypothetical protein
MNFPPEVDLSFYRQRYPQLAPMDDQTLAKHFDLHGRSEGRQASSAALRAGFIPLFERFRPVLEIGPFDRPMVTGRGVSYFDVLDRDALIEKAKTAGRTGTVPHIDYVSPIGDLSVVDRTFAAVCSAHCIEHQPDLIAHLRHVGRLLDEGGYYFLAAPDKRFSFDHFIPESTVADIIQAHEEKHSVHTLANIIRHIGLSTHNDAPRHWDGEHADAGYHERISARIEKAIVQFHASNGNYIDVHAWRFSPASFRQMMEMLCVMGLIPFKVVRVYDTPRPRVEFMAILQKVSDKA